MTLIHVILFAFKPATEQALIADICHRIMALNYSCIHPATHEPYLKVSVGKDNSPEGQQGGLTHGFVMEFRNEEDRTFYLKEDASHLELEKLLAEVDAIETVKIVDFEPGIF